MREGNYIYVIRYGIRDHKIGYSFKPRRRLSQLSKNGHSLQLICAWHRPLNDARVVESIAHRFLCEWRLDIKSERERFEISAESACKAVELAISIVEDTCTHNSIATQPPEKTIMVPITIKQEFLKGHEPIAAEFYGPLRPYPVAKIGYMLCQTAYQKYEYRQKLIEAGAEKERIYYDFGTKIGDEFLSARKALRPGDTFVLIQENLITYDLLDFIENRCVFLQESFCVDS